MVGGLNNDILFSMKPAAQFMTLARTDFQLLAEAANIQAVGITSAFSPTLDVLSTIAMAIVAGYGGYLAINDLVTVGLIVTFLTYVRRFYEPIRAVSMIYANLQSAIAGAPPTTIH